MWPRVSDMIGSSNEKIFSSPFFLLKKYEPSRPMNSSRVTGRTLMSVSLAFHLARRSSAFGWFRTQASNVSLLVEGTPTCWTDSSTASQQQPVVDRRSGERSSIQFADLRRYGVLSSMKRWAWEEMKVWTMLVAAPVVPCCPSSSSFALLDVFPMITSDLRDFTQKSYSGSPRHVCLNYALVAMPFMRVHGNQRIVQTNVSRRPEIRLLPVNSKVLFSARMLLPPPASDDYSFWEYRCGVQ